MKASAFYKKLQWAFLISAITLTMFVAVALGNGTDVDVDVRQSNDMNNQTAGDVDLGDQIIKGGNTLALTSVLGAAAIADCKVTKQRSYVVFAHQWFEYDVWCIGDKLDTQGKYKAAAEYRCTDKGNRKTYGNACLTILNFDPGESAVPNPNPEPTYDYETAYAAQQEEIEEVREQLAVIIERQQQQQRAIPPARAVSANTAVIEAMKQKEVEREAKESEAKAFFRAKYEAAQQRELDNED